MDGQKTSHSISTDQLYTRLGTALAPVVVDVRKADDFDPDDRVIASAIRRDPERDPHWFKGLSADRTIVAYCVHGRNVSQEAAAALRGAGLQGVYLDGGIANWKEKHFPTRRRLRASTEAWVTREHPKIDRIACPWLISRFIDPKAEFLYVPASEVFAVASDTSAIAYDIEGADFAHEGERCSFDTILRVFGVEDSALERLALIVRGADTSRHDLSPQCSGLFAISLGLSANFPNDHEMLAHGMVMYDALYTWCRSLQSETHNWPTKAPVNQAAAFQNRGERR
jgi:rhodanese-related sulfurtransferase